MTYRYKRCSFFFDAKLRRYNIESSHSQVRSKKKGLDYNRLSPYNPLIMRYQKSKVSILIPAKNEGEGLRKIIRSVKPYGFEIIVVDGHSTDNSREITENEGATFILDHGRGRGDGVRMGLRKAKGPIILMFDADGSHK